ncbi:histidinol-phosphatase [Thiorhodovibrio frisius]|uniref:Histidinol-phosphatase n=1 Tax=Thiorhodovibrio frisius TaxID=631362 RepID=H8Z1C2_9GAMM|nr:HAD family hydrolase [Thiorhodovibrio frisius]EIC22471.1 HAD-superfamily subfamily IB hydrolase, TIGR01490 [Thiorhodovibrio frisius]WPL24772.1 Phosphoserine phosphatase [Thiorhodovibrio frisius]
MQLTIFDLDNTLLEGDSDYLWGCHLIEQGVVDAADYERQNSAFYADYRNGCLDIDAFLGFSLQPLSQHSLDHLHAWRDAFVREKIDPIILPEARALIEKHRGAGDRLLIITATNRFVTAPIAERLGIADLIATDPEFLEGRYTGRVAGTPAFQQGKVERLHQWLREQGLTMPNSRFYSDSINDLPLLSAVGHPVAVDPDPQLAAIASEHGWPIISLRGNQPPN